MALRPQVINFIWLRFLNDTHQVTAITEVSIVQLKARITHVRILINVIDALSIKT